MPNRDFSTVDVAGNKSQSVQGVVTLYGERDPPVGWLAIMCGLLVPSVGVGTQELQSPLHPHFMGEPYIEYSNVVLLFPGTTVSCSRRAVMQVSIQWW